MGNNWKQKAAIFLTSQMLSMFGSLVVGFVVIWYITLQTASAGLMTISILCTFLPQILISPIAGVWADRYNRKNLIMISDLITACATLILAICFFMGLKSFVLLFVLTAVRSVGAGIQAPAVGAILPQIVPEDKLVRVNGLNASLSSVMMLMAPVVGGLLLGISDFSYALFLDVITAILAVAVMMFLKISKHNQPDRTESYFMQLKNGINYARNNKLIKNLLLFYLLFFFFVTPAAFLTPIMIARSFGSDIWRLTANEIVWTIGSLIGGVLISVWGGFKNRLSTMALSCVGFGITFALLGLVSNFYWYLAIMLISGVFMPIFYTAETVLIQEHVDEHMLGRIFSIIQIIASISLPLGMIIFGPLGDIFSIQWVLFASGIFLVLLSVLIYKAGKYIAVENNSTSIQ